MVPIAVWLKGMVCSWRSSWHCPVSPAGWLVEKPAVPVGIFTQSYLNHGRLHSFPLFFVTSKISKSRRPLLLFGSCLEPQSSEHPYSSRETEDLGGLFVCAPTSSLPPGKTDTFRQGTSRFDVIFAVVNINFYFAREYFSLKKGLLACVVLKAAGEVGYVRSQSLRCSLIQTGNNGNNGSNTFRAL